LLTLILQRRGERRATINEELGGVYVYDSMTTFDRPTTRLIEKKSGVNLRFAGKKSSKNAPQRAKYTQTDNEIEPNATNTTGGGAKTVEKRFLKRFCNF
jgi:hypothetical protein